MKYSFIVVLSIFLTGMIGHASAQQKVSKNERIAFLSKQLSISEDKASALSTILEDQSKEVEKILADKSLNSKQQKSALQAQQTITKTKILGVLSEAEYERFRQAALQATQAKRAEAEQKIKSHNHQPNRGS